MKYGYTSRTSPSLWEFIWWSFFPSLAFDYSFFTINVTTAILEGHNFISSYDFSTKTVKFNMHKICIEIL
jgi:hypothetical protein